MSRNLAEVLESTADAAFAADDDGRIVSWNQAAETLLGYSADEVLGRPCHEVICGCDVYGNRYCDDSCPILRIARRHEPVRHFEIDVRQAAGGRRRVGVSVFALPGTAEGARPILIHLLLPAAAAAPEAPCESAAAPAVDPAAVLTPREIEVLRLLAAGHVSQEIAGRLYVSLTTVRTHVQNILHKLGVHSQIEAVSLAFRTGLI